jgi:hypothetical protein
MATIERVTFDDPLTPREFAAVLGQIRQAISGPAPAQRIRLSIAVAQRLCGREAITTSFVEETNAWLAKLGLAMALLPTTLVLVDVDGVYNWKRPSTKKANEVIMSVKKDKSLLERWFNSLRKDYEAESNEDDDGDNLNDEDN